VAELASYAVHEQASPGRLITEPKPKARTEYQRDRDRIIHSTAFRRLEYKTQVFVNHEGDLFRTRLTHSIEVAQLAKTIARALHLNDDLTEAIALAHDLGHTPFGHAGQDALNECMKSFGGFEHNLQSLRTVERLEERYGAFDGLNLMYETKEGILKHCSQRNAELLGALGQRFLDKQRPSLEAQICNLADEVAYNNHDVDDGLRSGLITIEQLREISLFARHEVEAKQEYPAIGGRRLIHETIRRMIDAQVTNILAESERRIEEARPQTVADVRQAAVLIGFSPEMAEENRQLKTFLRDELYRHYLVQRMTSKARRIIADLFNAFMADVRLLPPQYQQRAAAASDDPMVPDGRARAVADYIAGMTDRYAMREHRRLFAIGEI
jgi:dGTPase